jgi:hypothetical protein
LKGKPQSIKSLLFYKCTWVYYVLYVLLHYVIGVEWKCCCILFLLLVHHDTINPC